MGFEKITSVLKTILSQLAIILHATVAKFYLPASTEQLQINIKHCFTLYNGGVEIFNPPSSFSMLELSINKQYALFSK